MLPTEILTIGDHIRAKRVHLGLSQSQVAKKIGVTPDAITNWELNRNEPRISYMPKIIACLLYTSPSPRDATLSRMPSSA